MSCTYPLMINSRLEGIVSVPCGRCLGCRLDRAKDWALRCMCEAEMHEKNCFLTLTYNNENLPEDGSINMDHLQLFIKRLRKKLGDKKIRYYACGEYGDKMERPHYHMILFGYDFVDKVFHHVSESSSNRYNNLSNCNKVYVSEILSDIWKMGFCAIGEVTMESCGYVARYIRKKIGGEMAITHYNGKKPEFAIMSRRPGIGSNWYDKYKNDLYPKDFVTFDGRKYRPPRYYDNRLMRDNWDLYQHVKEKRKEKIKKPDIVRREQKDKYLKNVTKTLRRRMENG